MQVYTIGIYTLYINLHVYMYVYTYIHLHVQLVYSRQCMTLFGGSSKSEAAKTTTKE